MSDIFREVSTSNKNGIKAKCTKYGISVLRGEELLFKPRYNLVKVYSLYIASHFKVEDKQFISPFSCHSQSVSQGRGLAVIGLR